MNECEPQHADDNSGYASTVKSTWLIGGSSAINLLIGAVRYKFLAILLGPAGIGLMAAFQSIISMANTLSCFGLANSGVRQIAEASGSDDPAKISRTIAALRRVVKILGIVGTLVLAALCVPVSILTFKTPDYAWSIAILSATVFFYSVSAGQSALIQGLRKISYISRLNVFGALFSTLAGIPFVYFFGLNGLVPFLIVIPVVSLLTSWWYARKIHIEPARLTWRETFHESRGMLRIGFAFLASNLAEVFTTYLILVQLIRFMGAGSAGQYQAAYMIAGLYAGFILQAMGTDFYPRITRAAEDNSKCNRMMNEQVEVSLLMSGPGVMITLALAPVVIHVFYAASFTPAIILLRWLAIGVIFRIATWPLKYLVIAKGRGSLYVITQVSANAVQIIMAYVGIRYLGLEGAAMAFVAMCVLYFAMMTLVARKLSGFAWSGINMVYGAIILVVSVAVFLASVFLGHIFSMVFGCVAGLVIGVFSLRRLLPTLAGTRAGQVIMRFMPSWFLAGK